MQAAKLEPVVIEDLVEIGRDMGLEEGIERGRAEGVEKGVEKGRAEGVEKGRAEGVEKGRAEGIEAARDMLLEAIGVRGLSLTNSQRERIRQERSLDRLRVWHRTALEAESMTTVLGE